MTLRVRGGELTMDELLSYYDQQLLSVLTL